MIGRIEDPEFPGRNVYVPLWWNRQKGRWEQSRGGAGGISRCLRSIDAGISCWLRLRDRYRALVKEARVLRVMCEHPDFAFEGDAVSADMVRERVRVLSRDMSLEEADMERLLDQPEPDDDVYILDVRYDLEPHSRRLEPRDGRKPLMVPSPPPGPRARHAWLVHICALFAKELTGAEHAPAEVEDAVERVQERLRDEREGEQTEH